MTSTDDRKDRVSFIVGAGRSGTTLLFKLLCLHPGVAYISNYENRLRQAPGAVLKQLFSPTTDRKLRAWFGDRGNAYFLERPLSKMIVPTPVEGESVMAACGVPLFPSRDEVLANETVACLRRRFEEIRNGAGAKLLLCKRTANNRRLPQLDAAFPSAKYVHLVRDGRDVARSLSRVEWWDDHTVWWDGRTASEMQAAGEDRLAICARNWVREIEEISYGLGRIDRSRQLELHFDALLEDPERVLGGILEFLGLDVPDEFLDAVRSLGLRPRPASSSRTWDDDDYATVMAEAGPMLERLGYVELRESRHR